MVDFCVKRFHMMKGVTISCLFTLKTPKTTNLSLRRIFFSGGFRVLGWFIGFLVVMDWFNKVYMMFSRCFGSKMGWKWDFRWRNKGPRFFRSPQRPDSRFRRRHAFFLKYVVRPIKFFLKIKARALYWARRYEARFTRPGNTWPNSFFFYFQFF